MTEEKSKMSIATFYRRVKFLCNGLFILTVVWITLTLYHQYLLHKLSVFTTENHIIDSKILEKNLRSLKQIFSKIIIDSGGMYRILHNVHKARNDVYRREFNKSVTLVTHCSVNHVTKIISLANIWSGPIILTVFIPNSGFVYGLEKISYMLKCTREQLKNVTVHVVTDFTTSQELFPLDIERVQQILCNDSMQKNLTQWKRNYALEASEYPNNLLRNIGIQTASSEYVFTIDIDMIPSSNFYNYLSKFLHQSSTDIVKTVYVIPAFEIESKSPMPVDKKKLLEMWNNRLIRPFYLELCDKCQRPTDYQQWRGKDIPKFNSISKLLVARSHLSLLLYLYIIVDIIYNPCPNGSEKRPHISIVHVEKQALQYIHPASPSVL